MRRRARIDANQPAIVKALREAGATILHLHAVGKGCPDICVGWKGANFLFEIKDPEKPLNQRKLSDDESAVHAAWMGQISVIENAAEAFAVLK